MICLFKPYNIIKRILWPRNIFYTQQGINIAGCSQSGGWQINLRRSAILERKTSETFKLTTQGQGLIVLDNPPYDKGWEKNGNNFPSLVSI